MAYKNKEDEKAAKKRWAEKNPERIQAHREKYNAQRKQKLQESAEYRAKLAADRKKLRSEMTPEELDAYYASRRKYQREWQKANYDRRYEKHKIRMKEDPAYAENYLKKSRERNAKRKHCRGVETPEEKEARLRRNREAAAKLRKEKQMMAALVPAEKRAPKPKAPRKKKPTPPAFEAKKPGRILALAGWRGW